ncbi:MAG: hypothetical protein ACI9U6_002503 [Loktanella salsilacus]|jgi:hypothetical protein
MELPLKIKPFDIQVTLAMGIPAQSKGNSHARPIDEKSRSSSSDEPKEVDDLQIDGGWAVP